MKILVKENQIKSLLEFNANDMNNDIINALLSRYIGFESSFNVLGFKDEAILTGYLTIKTFSYENNKLYMITDFLINNEKSTGYMLLLDMSGDYSLSVETHNPNLDDFTKTMLKNGYIWLKSHLKNDLIKDVESVTKSYL